PRSSGATSSPRPRPPRASAGFGFVDRPLQPGLSAGVGHAAQQAGVVTRLLLVLVDLALELLQHPLAFLDPIPRIRLARALEPVALSHPFEPGRDLLELGADLLRLLVGEILPEGLELDLLGEVHLAVLDDLLVVLL